MISSILLTVATPYHSWMIRVKIIGLSCRISSLLQGSFEKETYNYIDPTNQSYRISFMDDTRARRMHDTRINACVMTHASTYVWHIFMNVCVAYIHTHTCMCCMYSCISSQKGMLSAWMYVWHIFMYLCTCMYVLYACICCWCTLYVWKKCMYAVYEDMNVYHTYIHTSISVHSYIPFIYTCIHLNCTDILMDRCYAYTLACHIWVVLHCECVMSHIQTSHATHMRSSRTSVRAAMRTAFRTSINESCHTYKRAMSCAWIRHEPQFVQ